MAFRPYLFLAGTCRAAFTRYQEIFGGELTLMRAGDVPGGEMPPGDPDTIIHAALVIGDDLLMGSDDPTADMARPTSGISISYDARDAHDARRVLEALGDGGTITQPVEPTFFSSGFGMGVDRFGVSWMVVAPDPNQSGGAAS